MRCPKCGCVEDKVVDSRSSKDGLAIRRRRQCPKCSQRYTTYEEIERGNLMVIKDGGARERFSAKSWSLASKSPAKNARSAPTPLTR
ncbi:MAG: hypothetical protein Ct9H300mP32_6440 [Verrucomicrobiota bacterium]|nr:MAG: hypothetical protein Ct9H300mP32_6440 [Verrucomicrobiota bacterium]